MVHGRMRVLSPIANIARERDPEARTNAAGKGQMIGLLNNSKPNVDIFLAALSDVIAQEAKDYSICEITKSRSAGPCPDLDMLANRCRFVVNAVAD